MRAFILPALLCALAAPAFADCTYVKCSQARQANDLYVNGTDADQKAILVDAAGGQRDVTLASWGFECKGTFHENNDGAFFTIDRQPVDLSLLYVGGKNVATSVGCAHDKPAAL